jgi:hypothetical protein
VLVGSKDKCVYALETRTGKPRWKHTAAGTVRGCLLAVGPLVYVGDGSGRLAALRFADGKVIWRVSLGRALLSPPATDGKALYIVDEGAAEGEPLWDDIVMRSGARLLCVEDGQSDPKLLRVVLGMAHADDPDARIARLIRELGDERWITREYAEQALADVGPPAVAQLTEALKTTRDAEVRQRITRLLEKIGTAPAPVDHGRLPRQLGLDHDVDYLLRWLTCDDAGLRTAVHRRLSKVLPDLAARFDPAADAAKRKVQLAGAMRFWERRRGAYRWNPAAGKYVPTE